MKSPVCSDGKGKPIQSSSQSCQHLLNCRNAAGRRDHCKGYAAGKLAAALYTEAVGREVIPGIPVYKSATVEEALMWNYIWFFMLALFLVPVTGADAQQQDKPNRVPPQWAYGLK